MSNELDEREIALADKVADEILIREKRINVFLWLFLLLFVLLLSLFSALVIAKIGYKGRIQDNYIKQGSILFSFEEGSKYINIVNAMPIKDIEGMQMNGDNEYFTFGVATSIKAKTQPKITYEISITPEVTTLNPKYVRVYLVEDGKEILINGNKINNFSSLPNSTIRKNSKVLYKYTTTSEIRKRYTLRMWVSEDYELPLKPEKFSAIVNVDAY